MANWACKFRTYPTSEQITFFRKSFGCVRKYWNVALTILNEQMDNQKPLKIPYPSEVKKRCPYMKEIDALALANVQMNLQQAFKNFYKNPKHFNKPKFKSKKYAKKSYTTNCVNHNIRITDSFIRLPKVGNVKIKLHRRIPDGYVLKSATVMQDCDGKFYISVLFECEVISVAHQIDESKAVGFDYKSNGFYVSSDGQTLGSPRSFRKYEKRLVREQKKLSRKVNSSKNYYKQLQKVNKVYAKIKHSHKDFAHQVSRKITNCYDIVCLEDLNLQQIANKGFGNGKATNDNVFGMFREFLAYKMQSAGKVVIKVGRFYPSSQLCSICGYKNPLLKNLQIRKWECPNCGTHHDRDVNAAVNILHEGLRIYRAGIA